MHVLNFVLIIILLLCSRPVDSRTTKQVNSVKKLFPGDTKQYVILISDSLSYSTTAPNATSNSSSSTNVPPSFTATSAPVPLDFSLLLTRDMFDTRINNVTWNSNNYTSLLIICADGCLSVNIFNTEPNLFLPPIQIRTQPQQDRNWKKPDITVNIQGCTIPAFQLRHFNASFPLGNVKLRLFQNNILNQFYFAVANFSGVFGQLDIIGNNFTLDPSSGDMIFAGDPDHLIFITVGAIYHDITSDETRPLLQVSGPIAISNNFISCTQRPTAPAFSTTGLFSSLLDITFVDSLIVGGPVSIENNVINSNECSARGIRLEMTSRKSQRDGYFMIENPAGIMINKNAISMTCIPTAPGDTICSTSHLGKLIGFEMDLNSYASEKFVMQYNQFSINGVAVATAVSIEGGVSSTISDVEYSYDSPIYLFPSIDPIPELVTPETYVLTMMSSCVGFLLFRFSNNLVNVTGSIGASGVDVRSWAQVVEMDDNELNIVRSFFDPLSSSNSGTTTYALKDPAAARATGMNFPQNFGSCAIGKFALLPKYSSSSPTQEEIDKWKRFYGFTSSADSITFNSVMNPCFSSSEENELFFPSQFPPSNSDEASLANLRASDDVTCSSCSRIRRNKIGVTVAKKGMSINVASGILHGAAPVFQIADITNIPIDTQDATQRHILDGKLQNGICFYRFFAANNAIIVDVQEKLLTSATGIQFGSLAMSSHGSTVIRDNSVNLRSGAGLDTCATISLQLGFPAKVDLAAGGGNAAQASLAASLLSTMGIDLNTFFYTSSAQFGFISPSQLSQDSFGLIWNNVMNHEVTSLIASQYDGSTNTNNNNNNKKNFCANSISVKGNPFVKNLLMKFKSNTMNFTENRNYVINCSSLFHYHPEARFTKNTGSPSSSSQLSPSRREFLIEGNIGNLSTGCNTTADSFGASTFFYFDQPSTVFSSPETMKIKFSGKNKLMMNYKYQADISSPLTSFFRLPGFQNNSLPSYFLVEKTTVTVMKEYLSVMERELTILSILAASSSDPNIRLQYLDMKSSYNAMLAQESSRSDIKKYGTPNYFYSPTLFDRIPYVLGPASIINISSSDNTFTGSTGAASYYATSPIYFRPPGPQAKSIRCSVWPIVVTSPPTPAPPPPTTRSPLDNSSTLAPTMQPPAPTPVAIPKGPNTVCQILGPCVLAQYKSVAQLTKPLFDAYDVKLIGAACISNSRTMTHSISELPLCGTFDFLKTSFHSGVLTDVIPGKLLRRIQISFKSADNEGTRKEEDPNYVPPTPAPQQTTMETTAAVSPRINNGRMAEELGNSPNATTTISPTVLAGSGSASDAAATTPAPEQGPPSVWSKFSSLLPENFAESLQVVLPDNEEPSKTLQKYEIRKIVLREKLRMIDVYVEIESGHDIRYTSFEGRIHFKDGSLSCRPRSDKINEQSFSENVRMPRPFSFVPASITYIGMIVASATTMISMLLAGSGAVGTSLSLHRFLNQYRIMDCQQTVRGTSIPFDIFDHPLQFSISGSYAAGSLVGNGIIIVVVSASIVGMIKYREREHKKRMFEARFGDIRHLFGRPLDRTQKKLQRQVEQNKFASSILNSQIWAGYPQTIWIFAAMLLHGSVFGFSLEISAGEGNLARTALTILFGMPLILGPIIFVLVKAPMIPAAEFKSKVIPFPAHLNIKFENNGEDNSSGKSKLTLEEINAKMLEDLLSGSPQNNKTKKTTGHSDADDDDGIASETSSADEGNNNNEKIDEPETCCQSIKNILKPYFGRAILWRNRQAESRFVERFAFAFEDLSTSSYFVVYIEILLTFVVAILEGVPANSIKFVSGGKSCTAVAILKIFVSCCSLVVAMLRPYCIPFLNGFNLLVNVFGCLSIMFQVVDEFLHVDDGDVGPGTSGSFIELADVFLFFVIWLAVIVPLIWCGIQLLVDPGKRLKRIVKELKTWGILKKKSKKKIEAEKNNQEDETDAAEGEEMQEKNSNRNGRHENIQKFTSRSLQKDQEDFDEFYSEKDGRKLNQQATGKKKLPRREEEGEKRMKDKNAKLLDDILFNPDAKHQARKSHSYQNLMGAMRGKSTPLEYSSPDAKRKYWPEAFGNNNNKKVRYQDENASKKERKNNNQKEFNDKMDLL